MIVSEQNGYSKLMCHAHTHGVRVTFGEGLMDANQWSNATAVRAAGQNLIEQFDLFHSDGVNLDVEMTLQNQSQADLLLNVTQNVAGMVTSAKP